MNSDQKTKLESIFNSQQLSLEDRNFWLTRLENISEETTESILSLFETFPDKIDWFCGMQKQKELVLASKDHKKWQDILKQEQEFVESLKQLVKKINE